MDSPQHYQESYSGLSEKDDSEEKESVGSEEWVDLEVDLDDQRMGVIIAPFEVFFDSTYQRHYFYNTTTQESVWQLPYVQQEHLKQYKHQKAQDRQLQKERMINKYIDQEDLSKNKALPDRSYMRRPARKQLQTSLSE